MSAFKTDPDLLKLVLAAGGDPNITRPGGDPVITRFLDDANLDAIRYLAAHGASLDADVAQRPMVVGYAISEDWDVVLTLIELGAKLDNPRVREGMVFAFKAPDYPLPDSPLFPAKVKVWRHLKGLGLNPTPPMGM